MTLAVISPAPSTDRGGARILVRCACGVEKVIRRKHLANTKSCGCANLAVIAERRARAAERVRVVAPKLVVVPRLAPSASYRSDAALVGALVIALAPPLDELSFLPPVAVADVLAAVGCEPHDLARVVLRRFLEGNGERVWGRRCAASLVFGAEVVEQIAEAA